MVPYLKAYIIFSSMISFYVPMSVVLFAYASVYVIAAKHGKSMAAGRKKISQKAPCATPGQQESVYIRVHRGGGGSNNAQACRKANVLAEQTTASSLFMMSARTPQGSFKRNFSQSSRASREMLRNNSRISNRIEMNEIEVLETLRPTSNNNTSPNTANAKTDKTAVLRQRLNLMKIMNQHIRLFKRKSDLPSCKSEVSLEGLGPESSNLLDAMVLSPMGGRRGKRSKPKLFVKFMREKRAAKTLGIVVGCFLACWLPFFVVNILVVACTGCLLNPDLIFTLATWLGHCNSALNPLIYAVANREFKKAFKQILCEKQKRHSTLKGLGKATESVLKVMVVQFGRQADLNVSETGGAERFEEVDAAESSGSANNSIQPMPDNKDNGPVTFTIGIEQTV